MEADEHSMTAVIMAAIRAYHCEAPEPRIFEDRMSRCLLSSDEYDRVARTIVRWYRRFSTDAEMTRDPHVLIHAALRAGPGPGVLVRARYIEDRLLSAMEIGISQYVIIGAGLDTFACRHSELAERLQIIEIDHPATQALKRNRMMEAGLAVPANLHLTSADLERESLEAALQRTPYDPGRRTFFAWPGVTMYLSQFAVRQTLLVIARLAADESQLVFDYLEPAAFSEEAPLRMRFGIRRARDLGEPMVSGFNPTELAHTLALNAWRLVEDLGPADIQARLIPEGSGHASLELYHLARARIDSSLRSW